MSCNDFPSMAEHVELELRVETLEAQVAVFREALTELSRFFPVTAEALKQVTG